MHGRSLRHAESVRDAIAVLHRGGAALAAGRVGDACRWHAEAEHGLARCDPLDLHPVGVVWPTTAHALLGDADRASALLTMLDDDLRDPSGAARPGVGDRGGWPHRRRGRTRLDGAAQAAEAGQGAIQVALLHDAVRLGTRRRRRSTAARTGRSAHDAARVGRRRARRSDGRCQTGPARRREHPVRGAGRAAARRGNRRRRRRRASPGGGTDDAAPPRRPVPRRWPAGAVARAPRHCRHLDAPRLTPRARDVTRLAATGCPTRSSPAGWWSRCAPSRHTSRTATRSSASAAGTS